MSSTAVTPDNPVPCPASNRPSGRTFVNIPPETNLGATFAKDFASACSTAFVGLSLQLSAADLTKAAGAFGVGGWRLPVTSYFAGNIDRPTGAAQLAADTIGVGQVQVSPLGMALAAAVVDSGKWHTPSLVPGLSDPSSVSRVAESPRVLAALRSLMRAAVINGSGQAANVSPGVYGQVGNAAFNADKHLRMSWFVGYQDDIAFAVVELGKSPSASAAPLAGSFLQNIQTGS